jgi:uncharacterized protein (DUF433 family)
MSTVVSGVVMEGVIVPETALPEGCRVDVLVPEGATAGAPVEAVIHDRGRGPEVRGTRITVYNFLDYLIAGWPIPRIATLCRIGVQEVEAAVAYIEQHRAEVMGNYARIVERAERGNPPEVQARLDAGHRRFQELVARVRSLEERDPEQRRQKISEMIRQHREAGKEDAAHAGDHGRQ